MALWRSYPIITRIKSYLSKLDANNAVLVVIGFFLSHGVSPVNSTNDWSRVFASRLIRFWLDEQILK